MKRQGTVIGKEQDRALVRIRRLNGCGEHCVHCGACNDEPEQIEALCGISVNVGDRVEVETSDRTVWLGMLSLFIFPVLLPLIAYVLIENFWGQTIGIVGAVSVLAVCLVWIGVLNRSERYLRKSRAVVVRRIDNTCNPR